MYAPYASIHLFRWAHMAHHRFTNDDGDPDIWSHGAWWSLPFRWMTIDFYYGYRAMTSDDPAVQKVFKQSIPILLFGLALIALLVYVGYGYEYLMLWFVPTRLAFLFIGYSFFWLPHAHWPSDEHDLRQSENITIATTLRRGNEWLFQHTLSVPKLSSGSPSLADDAVLQQPARLRIVGARVSDA